MKKILYIDMGDYEYFQQLVKSARKYADVDVITKYYSSEEHSQEFFYKYSNSIKNYKLKKIIKGLEYIVGWIKTMNYIKGKEFDVVHIHWALVPRVDSFFWKQLKKRKHRIVYTAHDVIPHIYDEKLILLQKDLYNLADKVIVHGEFCKNELLSTFHLSEEKIFIQYHGVYEKKEILVSSEVYEKHKELLKKTANKKCVFGFLGQINEYKGIDLLEKVWEHYANREDILLIVAGKTIDAYADKFENIKERLKTYKNVYLYNEYYSEEEEVLFNSVIDIVTLPYRSASMSGVLFSATKYDKTVMVTQVGCLGEYIHGIENDCYIVEPNCDEIKKGIDAAIEDSNIKGLIENKGKHFSNYFYQKYDWNTIIRTLIEKCY